MSVRSLFATVFLFLIMLIATPSSYAFDHVVKGGILIPNDWKDRITQRQLEEFKQGAIHGLQAAQIAFSHNLDGKTFIYDSNITVQTAYKNIGELDSQSFSSAFSNLDGYSLFPKTPGVIWVVWVVGSTNDGNFVAWGSSGSKDDGLVVMQFNLLLALSRTSDSEWERQREHDSQLIIAHELTHSFGLLHAGYAKAHPCTEASPSECTENAPHPLPPANEWNYSILGYGSWDRILPNVPLEQSNIGFNNSVHNPEKWKLYQSPFINPGGIAGPDPSAKKDIRITESALLFDHAVIRPKDTLIIRGSSFGQFKNKVTFVMPGALAGDYPVVLDPEQYVVTDWKDQAVTVVFRETVEQPTTKRVWQVEVENNDGSIIRSTNTIATVGDQVERQPATAYTQFQVTCGDTHAPFPHIPVRLLSLTGEELAVAETDIQGRGDITYPEPEYHDTYDHIVSVGTVPGVGTAEPESQNLRVVHNDPTIPFSSFHFASCAPGIVQPTPNPDKPQTATIYIDGKITNVGTYNLQNLVLSLEVTPQNDSPYPDLRTYHDINEDGIYWIRAEKVPLFNIGEYFCRIIARSPTTGESFSTDQFSCKTTVYTNYYDFSVFYGPSGVQQPFEGNPDFTPTPPPTETDRKAVFRVKGTVKNRKAGSLSDLTVSLYIIPPTNFSNYGEWPHISDDGTYEVTHTVSDARYISSETKCSLNVSAGDKSSGPESFPCDYLNTYTKNLIVDYDGQEVHAYFEENAPTLEEIEGVAPPPILPVDYSPSIESPDTNFNTEPIAQGQALVAIVISNYADFRSDNTPDDEGNKTEEFAADSSRNVIWKLSTNSSWHGVYIREKYSDGGINEYSQSLENDQTIQPGSQLTITGKIIKKIAYVTINGQVVDADDGGEVAINLVGDTQKTESYTVPIFITYTDGEVIYDALQVNYQPPEDSATPIQDQTPIESPVLETPAQPISTCQAPYNQCGGTAGLEELPPENTYFIQPQCDQEGNIIGYNEPEFVNSSCGQ